MALHRRQVTYSSNPNRAARAAHARGDREFRTYDTSYIQPKKSRVPIIVAIVLAVIVVVAAVLIIRSCTAAPAVELLEEGETATIVVKDGEAASETAQSLADAHLVESSDSFIDLVARQNAASSIIPGTYIFEGGTSPEDILQTLLSGPLSQGATVTIPEGFTRAAIASRVEEATGSMITEDEFLAASDNASVYASDYDFLKTAGTNSLEGFLFPKTYTITNEDNAESVVRMMLDQFKTETASISWSYPEEHDIDLYGAVTLASIVEKESADSNRATVASVFYNRLASDRPYLESDATTAYEVGHDPTGDEVHSDSPYSTYTHEGLPPTPICSPSIESLRAVCYPDETDYQFFYFAENDDGEMVYAFSETYEEHQEAIDSLS